MTGNLSAIGWFFLLIVIHGTSLLFRQTGFSLICVWLLAELTLVCGGMYWLISLRVWSLHQTLGDNPAKMMFVDGELNHRADSVPSSLQKFVAAECQSALDYCVTWQVGCFACFNNPLEVTGAVLWTDAGRWFRGLPAPWNLRQFCLFIRSGSFISRCLSKWHQMGLFVGRIYGFTCLKWRAQIYVSVFPLVSK